jgi:methylase of polypeptide subunit release factors
MQDTKTLFENSILSKLSEDDFDRMHDALARDFDPKYQEFFRDENEFAPLFWRDHAEDRELFGKARLLEFEGGNYVPKFRIFKVGREGKYVFVTTDFLLDKPDRIYAWEDEAEALLDYTYPRQLTEPESVLDMCTGAGSIALALGKLWDRARITGVDINPRAVVQAEFNRRLNGLDDRIQFRHGDLFEGCNKYDLIVADPPFTLHHPKWTASNWSGGPLGDRVIERMLKVCRNHLNPGGRFISLAYSLGNEDEPTRLQEMLVNHLGESAPEKLTVHPLENLKVWRYQERKCMPNPMPLEYMVIRCADSAYNSYHEQGADLYQTIESYVDWIEKDLKRGGEGGSSKYTHLHYVVVDYRADPA